MPVVVWVSSVLGAVGEGRALCPITPRTRLGTLGRSVAALSLPALCLFRLCKHRILCLGGWKLGAPVLIPVCRWRPPFLAGGGPRCPCSGWCGLCPRGPRTHSPPLPAATSPAGPLPGFPPCCVPPRCTPNGSPHPCRAPPTDPGRCLLHPLAPAPRTDLPLPPPSPLLAAPPREGLLPAVLEPHPAHRCPCRGLGLCPLPISDPPGEQPRGWQGAGPRDVCTWIC